MTGHGSHMAASGDGVPADWAGVVRYLSSVVPTELVAEIDSTNTELMRRARACRAGPVLLVALAQTAGRGRLGRGWASALGGSLTFSLGLPLAPADWSGLSLAVGLAVAQALHPRIGLKWPNDLWLDGRKLAGILVETASFAAQGAQPAAATTAPRAQGAAAPREQAVAAPRYAVVGVGINIAAPQGAQALSTPPAALRELLPQADAAWALRAVAPPLVRALAAFEREGFAPLQEAFAARDVLRGRAVALSDGRAGTAAGVAGDGGLLVHTAAGMTTVTSAEVSVRPAG